LLRLFRSSARHCPVCRHSKGLFQGSDERRQGDTKSLTKFSEFHDIKSPFAPFALADEGLRLVNPGGEFDLAEAAVFPGKPKLAQERPVLPRGDAFIHKAPTGANIKSKTE
jgi:hypothetical protein